MTRISAGLSIKALCSPSPGGKPASVCSSILANICPSRDQPLDSPRGEINGYLRCSELTNHPGLVPPPWIYLAESGHIKAEGWSWGGRSFQVQEHSFLGLIPYPFPQCLRLKITSPPKTAYFSALTKGAWLSQPPWF